MKILIAYDGSKYANEAIDDLRFAGLPADTEALIVTVTETWLPSSASDYPTFDEITDNELKWPWRKRALEKIAESEKFALEAWELIRSKYPEWSARHETVSGYPEWAVVASAEKQKPDLIVVGSQGRGATERLVLGSVSLKVLSEASTSVLVARRAPTRNAGDDSPPRIMVGVDGSLDSKLAVETVCNRHWPQGTEICLVTAVEPYSDPDFEDRARIAEELRRAAAARMEASGWKVSSIVKDGRAKDVLLQEAERVMSDVIFLGAKGYRFMEHIFLGSVSYSVAARASCSVEVVRG